jgi:serine protease Do
MKWGRICCAVAAMAAAGFAQSSAPRAHSAISRIVTRSGWLGVGLGEVTPERARTLNLKEARGVEITHVDDNSPAVTAGLKEGDVVLEVNGQKVDGREDFARMIGESSPGSRVTMTIWRSGSKQGASATLAARPANLPSYPNGIPFDQSPFPPEVLDGSAFEAMMGQSPRLGIEGETVAGQLADFFGVKQGVLVRSVAANSAASKAGLKAGDVIVKVNAMPVADTREISGIIRAGRKTASFTVVRNHKEITLSVELAEVWGEHPTAL